jgi:hypothetical protein
MAASRFPRGPNYGSAVYRTAVVARLALLHREHALSCAYSIEAI